MFRFWKVKKEHFRFENVNTYTNKNVDIQNLGEVLGSSIKNAINTVVMIGGFVVLFSVINSMLDNTHFFDVLTTIFSPVFNLLGLPINLCDSIFSGIIELTNGVSKVCTNTNSLNIIVCAFLLGFGGLSVLLQVLSITSKSNISIKPYIIGKFLHGCIAAIYTFLFL